MLGPKIFTNLHIIMYILIEFSVGGGDGWWGWGGGEEMFINIKSYKALSVLLGGGGGGGGIVGGKKLLLY